jgi:hypothetical protein
MPSSVSSATKVNVFRPRQEQEEGSNSRTGALGMLLAFDHALILACARRLSANFRWPSQGVPGRQEQPARRQLDRTVTARRLQSMMASAIDPVTIQT